MSLPEQIFNAGVVGAGGAGFPTHKKLADGVRLLLINAAECEPLLASDRYVMRSFADEIIEGISAMREELHAPRAVIGTKSKYTREIAALRAAIERQNADIEIAGVDGFYPAGDEQVLIYEVCGETVPPGGIPLALGIVVINVTTALNICRAMRGIPVTRRYVTVTGRVGRPVIADVPVGTSIAGCIEAADSPVAEPFAIIKGGPMMGPRFPMEDKDSLVIGKADGGIILLEEDHPLIQFSKKPLQHMINQAKSVCIQCSYCTQLCPRQLIGHKLRPHRVMRSISTGVGAGNLTDALLCSECGVCELFACPMQLSPRRINIHIKGLLRERGINKAEDLSVYPEQAEARPYRKIAQSRFIDRLCLNDYPGTLDEAIVWEPESVRIPLKHGIGRPATPLVTVGDHVKTGDLIAGLDFKDMGCLVHASIDGVVTAVDEGGVAIAREEVTAHD